MRTRDNIANLITLSRVVFALSLLAAEPFSPVFFLFYFLAGASDVIDGFVARKLRQESRLGEVLDSIADLVFLTVCISIAAVHIEIPVWLLVSALVIALVKVSAFIIDFRRRHILPSLHSTANRAVGLLLFASPVLYLLAGVKAAGLILCAAAMTAAIIELRTSVK